MDQNKPTKWLVHFKGWAFDEIALELPGKLEMVEICKENGWVSLKLPAHRLPIGVGELCYDEIAGPGREKVVLRPYIFCGFTADNRKYAQCYEEDGLIYDRNGERTEYRVMFPCFVRGK